MQGRCCCKETAAASILLQGYDLALLTSIAVWPAGVIACCCVLLEGLRRWMSFSKSCLPRMNWSFANSQRSGSTLRKPCRSNRERVETYGLSWDTLKQVAH